jgi:hypothetical protein
MEVVLEAEVVGELSDEVYPLPLQRLRELPAWGACRLSWISVGADPQTMSIEVAVKDLDGVVLDRRTMSFDLLNPAEGRLRFLNIAPETFGLGDTVNIQAAFDNVGTEPLQGQIVLNIANAAGALQLQEVVPFSQLSAGQTATLEVNWTNSDLSPRDCVILAYATYNSVSTDTLVAFDGTKLPFLQEMLAFSPQGAALRWPSISGRSYVVERCVDLNAGEFIPVSGSLPATPPENSFLDSTIQPQAHYRIVER